MGNLIQDYRRQLVSPQTVDRVSALISMLLGPLVGTSSLKASHQVKYDSVIATICTLFKSWVQFQMFWKPNELQNKNKNKNQKE